MGLFDSIQNLIGGVTDAAAGSVGDVVGGLGEIPGVQSRVWRQHSARPDNIPQYASRPSGAAGRAYRNKDILRGRVQKSVSYFLRLEGAKLERLAKPFHQRLIFTNFATV